MQGPKTIGPMVVQRTTLWFLIALCFCSAIIVHLFLNTGDKLNHHVMSQQLLRESWMMTEAVRGTRIYAPRPKRARSEVRHVIFLKVHKAASSTLQNIFLRFGMARNLSIMLPYNGASHINERGSEVFPDYIIPRPKDKLFDIFCDHILFNEKVLAPYFPSDTVRVGIVRAPMQQALSALAYYTSRFQEESLMSGLKKYNSSPLEGFLSHPEDFHDPSVGPQFSYINNRMSLDFGFDLKDLEKSKRDKNKIREFLERLDQQFDLVLVADYFDESMVLLRRRLNWSMKDILYLEVNMARERYGRFKDSVWNRKPLLNSTTAFVFRRWAAVDYELYEHFLTIFLNKIQGEPMFSAEVQFFRKIRDKVSRFCMRKTSDSARLRVSIKNLWTQNFTVSRLECKLMSMPEDYFVPLVVRNQIEQLNKSGT